MRLFVLGVVALLLGWSAPASARTNVAKGKTTTQSSDYTSAYGASNAVDGDVTTFSNTATDSQPWLQVDLSSIYSIDAVSIVNRTDCCQGRLADFYVLVSDNPIVASDLATARAQSGVSSYFFTGPGGERPTFLIGRTGRYVRVQLTSTSEQLNIAELQVFDTDSGVDVALGSRGGVASASSTYNGFVETNANDGVRASRFWNNAGPSLPDWYQIAFPLPQSIQAVNVFTVQDGYSDSEATLGTTFTQEGITDFQVQYWTGSAWLDVPGGHVTSNNHVWTQIAFSPITTTKMRVLVNATLDQYARITEFEAISSSPVGIVNGSFEVPAMGVDYTSPDGSGWTFNSAGFSKNATAFTSGNPSAPDGAQVVFLQGGGSWIEQSLTLPAGSYALSFKAAERGNYQYGTQIIQASIDGTSIGVFQPPGTSYTQTIMPFTVAAGGAHTVRLSGIGNGADYTAFVDDVRIVPPPPPTTLVAQYRFEEGGWAGNPGEVIDTGGASRNGVAVGSPLPSGSADNPAVATNPGTCAYANFSGSYNNGGNFLLQGIPLTTTPNSQTSVSFWMFWSGEDDMFPLGWNGYFLWIAWNSMGFYTPGQRMFSTPWDGLAGGWHHIAAVFVNGDDSSNQFWIDGVQKPLSTHGAYGNAVNTVGVVGGDLTVGGATNRSDRHYRGSALDDLKIYDGQISPAQIAADFAARHACMAASAPGAFDAFESATANGAVTGVIHTKVAASSFTFDVVALNSAGTALLPYFSGDVKVELLDARDNSGAFTGNCRSSWTPLGGSTPTTVTFTGTNTARQSIAVVESDAWRDLRVRMSYPATGTPTTVACSSDDFAIRPSSLAGLTATDANSATGGTARTLGNVSASGGVVHKAGQPFTIQAVAVNAISATTAHYDGTPTAMLAICSGSACPPVPTWITVANENGGFSFSGMRTVRYGASPNWSYRTFTGGGTCDNPTFGDPYPGVVKHCELSGGGILTTTPTAAAGVINSPASYNEVGGFTLQLIDTAFSAVDATDGSSMAERTVSSPIVNVGRFVPDHFELTALVAPNFRTFDTTSCGARSFTYIGQPFGLVNAAQASVAAKNAAGATTTAYAGNLWKLSAANLAQAYAPSPAAPTLDASALGAAALTSNGDGTGLLIGAATDKLRFNRPTAAPVGPFNANIALSWGVTDSSEVGVSGNGSITTPTPLVYPAIAFDAGSQMRFGVLRLTPAYGSELINLPVVIEALYWDGQRMALNTADQCTTVPAATLAMSHYQRQLAACKTAVANAPLSIVGGRGFAKLAKPGAGNSGSVDLALQLGAVASGQTCTAVGNPELPANAATMPWLQGRWSGAATFDQNPATRASFGQYRSPLIYQRESF